MTTLSPEFYGGGSATYSITGGPDADLFDLSTGVLTFASAPDFERPADSNSDNSYQVEITTAYGGPQGYPQTITVTVTDVNENPPPPDPRRGPPSPAGCGWNPG